MTERPYDRVAERSYDRATVRPSDREAVRPSDRDRVTVRPSDRTNEKSYAMNNIIQPFSDRLIFKNLQTTEEQS